MATFLVLVVVFLQENKFSEEDGIFVLRRVKSYQRSADVDGISCCFLRFLRDFLFDFSFARGSEAAATKKG